MKRLITLIILFCCFTSAGYSQSATTQSLQKQDTTKPVKWNENGKLIIGGGIGVGAFYFYGRGGNDEEGYYNYSPEFGGSVAYVFNNGFSIEAAIGYQTEDFGAITPTYYLWDSISRLNMSIGIIKHLNKHNRYFDHYIGVKIGCTYLTDTEVGPHAQLDQWEIGAPHLFLASVQGFYGLTWYPGGGPVGLNAEVGIGSPYLAQAGLLFRI